MTSAPESWQRVLWALLYSVQYEQRLTDALARSRALALILEPVHGFSPEEEHAALGAALESAAPLSEILPPPPETPRAEEELRDFAERVRRHMDELRPWPDLPFVTRLGPLWEDSAVIGRVRMGHMEVTERIRRHFQRPETGDDAPARLLLRLSSGDEVALVERGGRVDVLTRPESGRAPEDVLAAFLFTTGLTPGEVQDLTGGANPASTGGARTGWLAYMLRREVSLDGPGTVPFRVFLRTRLYCQATGSPGVVAVGRLVPAFTMPEALAGYAAGKGETEPPRYFSATGRDLLDLVPEGYGVLVDPGTGYATAFDRDGPR